MNRNLADFIITACNNADTFFQDEESMPEIYEDYSGKGMYRKTTTAITCDNMMAVMAAAMCEIVERLGYENETDDQAVELHDMLEDIRHLQTDSLGRTSTILY